MDLPTERAPETASVFDDLPATALSPLDPAEAFDLHRAINERRAQLENADMLRKIRSL